MLPQPTTLWIWDDLAVGRHRIRSIGNMRAKISEFVIRLVRFRVRALEDLLAAK